MSEAPASRLLRADGSTPARTNEPIVGLPCEGCEAVFQGLPETIAWSERLAPETEPGQPLRIDGVVRDASGQPRSGVIVYAYQTDARGYYPRAENSPGPDAQRHGRLRGFARTDAAGRYRFHTIRPAGYPDSDLPEHVHMHVIEVGRCSYYIDDIMFDDDPRLTDAAREQYSSGRGGQGIARPVKDGDTWLVTRDIVLGERIPGYAACEQGRAPAR